MPRVVNPNAVAKSLPGIVKTLQATTADIKGKARNAFNSLTIGAGGLIVSGISQFVGAITGPFNVTGSISATTSVTGANVNATSGIYTPAVVQGDTGIASVGVYNNLLTTAYKVQYIRSDGVMGYVPSSLQFKEDVETAPDIKAAMLAIRVVTFRYKEAVELLGDHALFEWGVIAEEFDALGLTWAVDYDETGAPQGVKYERIVLACIPVIQDHETRLRALET